MKKLRKIDNTYYLLALILLTGFWFRIQGFVYQTFAFTYDVGRDFLAVSGMLENHKPLLIGATTGLHGVFYGPTWYYLMTPFFILFNGDPSGIALVMATTGVITVFISFLLGNRVSDKLLGLIIAFFVAISQVMTEISAQIWNPNPIPMFLVLLIYLTFVYLKTKRIILISFLLGIILGIIFDLELVFGVLFIISFAVFLSFSKILKKPLLHSLIIALGFLTVQLPRIVFELRHDFLMTNTLFNAFTKGSGESLFTPIPKIQETVLTFFEVWKNTIAWQNTLIGIAVLMFVVFVLIRSFKKISKHEKILLKFLTIVFSVFFIGLCFFNHDTESHYYIGIPVLMITALGLSVYLFQKYVIKKQIYFIALIILFAILLNQLKLFGTFTKSTWVGDASVYRNQIEAAKFVYDDAQGDDFNVVVYTPPIHDYPYQYIFKWWGQNNYSYQPSKEYKKNFYLIIEPDLQIPERQKMWLEQRRDDGVVVYEKEFPSGIKIQKRFH